MGNSNTKKNPPQSFSFSKISNIDLFNLQQDTRSSIVLLDIRDEKEFTASHIDHSFHIPSFETLTKDWFDKLISLHQSSFSKAPITFYIIHNQKQDLALVPPSSCLAYQVCHWLSLLETPLVRKDFYYLSPGFDSFAKAYPYTLTSHPHYIPGRLFPSHVHSHVYLSNWGVASDPDLYLHCLPTITHIINCTKDLPCLLAERESEVYDVTQFEDYKEYCRALLNEESAGDMDKMQMYVQSNPHLRKNFEIVKDIRSAKKDLLRMKYLRVAVVDSVEEQILQYFDQAIHFIQEAQREKGEVLIHCRHGQSRSAAIACCYLMYANMWKRDKAVFMLKKCRPRISINAGFMQALSMWEQELHKKETVVA